MDGWGEVSRIAATARNSQSRVGHETPHISSLVFDNTANLLWCGDSSGHTTSHTPPVQDANVFGSAQHVPLYRYTKFLSAAPKTAIIQLLNHQRGILSLSNNSVGFNQRRGMSHGFYSSEKLSSADKSAFFNLACMALPYSTSSDVIIGGENALFKLDLDKPTQLQHYAHAGGVSHVNYSSKLLTLGKTSGSLEIFDPIANQSVKSFAGHSGLLSDLDVKGNYVATCGYSARSLRYGASSQNMEYMADPLVNIYDLRMMRSLAPVPFSAGASFVRFHPKLPNIIVIASANGQLQFVDIYDQSMVHLYQADLTDANSNHGSLAAPLCSQLAHMNISENGEFLAFADGYKKLHLWSLGTPTTHNFLNFPSTLDQPEVIDNTVSSANSVSLDDPAPLNSVGMPFYKEYLASNFPSDMTFIKETARVPQPVAEGCLRPKGPAKSVPPKFHYDKAKYGSHYVAAPFTSLRKNAHAASGPSSKISSVPKFISERSMTASPVLGVRALDNELSSVPAALSTLQDYNEIDGGDGAHNENDGSQNDTESPFQFKPDPTTEVPPCYEKLAIYYSRFGVDDFDFDYYNRSGGQSAGLENHIDNSYTNSLIQIYRHIPIFYNAITKSLLSEYLPRDDQAIYTLNNPQGSSVLNELGYLFDMMHKAGARNVSISNFSLILNESNIAKSHGIINKDDGKSLDGHELQNLIVTFNKFLIDSIVKGFGSQFGIDVQELTALHYEVEFMAPSREIIDRKYGSQVTLDLCSPPPHFFRTTFGNSGSRYTSPHSAKKNSTILNYLDYTLNQSRSISPSATTPFEVEGKQTLLELGPVLSINIPFTDQEFEQIRGFKKWLAPELYTVSGASRRLMFKPVITHNIQRAHKYELQGYVCEISHGPVNVKGQHNLVSYVKIRSAASGKDQWFLFNDFLVMPIPEEEVFDLSSSWKRPVVIVYSNSEDTRNQKFTYFESEMFRRLSSLNDSILYKDHFANRVRKEIKKEYELLTRQEAPAMGSLVAIDAEFVALRPEVAEVSYTGLRNLVRPKLLSLARISALRGSPGPKHGVAFIDDYIVHSKPIYDYLTTFSGIEENDLDVTKSKKILVTLQTTYRKLWLLLNLGCVFVGHGLKSDFRCINLQVPRAQIRDTIEFYYLPDLKRKLSLKFLAYAVLKQSVQTSNHDSIEDARTALLLFEKYQELKASGDFEPTLRRIYSDGQHLRFRVPE